MSGEQKVLQGTAAIAANGRVDRGVGLLCPKCAAVLRMERRFVVTGPAMVAGVMPKLSATDAPHLVCDGCGFVEAGKRPNAGGNATERSEGRVDHNVGRLTPGED